MIILDCWFSVLGSTDAVCSSWQVFGCLDEALLVLDNQDLPIMAHLCKRSNIATETERKIELSVL